jgi:hypothetical protein
VDLLNSTSPKDVDNDAVDAVNSDLEILGFITETAKPGRRTARKRDPKRFGSSTIKFNKKKS